MPNPDLIPEPFAQSGDKNQIPLERAISDPVYRASWKAGFPPDTRLPKDLGGEAPDGLDFNGVLNILSQAVVFLQKGNAYQFDAVLTPYPIGALVRSNDNLTTYQSTVPNNSNNPNSNMTGWRVYNGSGLIVDNLTTNDSAKALSAAQGKVLQDNKLGKTENAESATTAESCTGNSATATKLITASGSAPSYSARAWVNFNGANGAIRSSANVSSVIRNGVGNYTINFTTAMPITNYAPQTTMSSFGAGAGFGVVSQTASSITLQAVYGGDNTIGSFDPSICSLAIFC